MNGKIRKENKELGRNLPPGSHSLRLGLCTCMIVPDPGMERPLSGAIRNEAEAW